MSDKILQDFFLVNAPIETLELTPAFGEPSEVETEEEETNEEENNENNT